MEFKKIICAIDDSPLAESVFDAGYELAKQLNAEFALASVINPGPTSDGIDVETLRAYLKNDIIGLYEQLLTKKGNPKIQKFIENGDPKKQIVTIAKEWHADLIVIGSHGRSGFTRALMGSIAEGVIRHACCPVLIIPAAKS